MKGTHIRVYDHGDADTGIAPNIMEITINSDITDEELKALKIFARDWLDFFNSVEAEIIGQDF